MAPVQTKAAVAIVVATVVATLVAIVVATLDPMSPGRLKIRNPIKTQGSRCRGPHALWKVIAAFSYVHVHVCWNVDLKRICVVFMGCRFFKYQLTSQLIFIFNLQNMYVAQGKLFEHLFSRWYILFCYKLYYLLELRCNKKSWSRNSLHYINQTYKKDQHFKYFW